MNKKLELFLKFIVFSILISRAYQHIFWDVPYRTVFWCEPYFRNIVENTFKTPWEKYVSPEVDIVFKKIIKTIGLYFLSISILIWFITKENINKLKYFILPLFIWQFFILYCVTKESFFHIGMFLEHAIQVGAPFILYFYFKGIEAKKIILYSKLLIGLTFFCHGLYAFGYYPVPGGFVDMTLNITHITEEQARTFLKIIGFIDFIIFPMLFWKKATYLALYYCIIWGILTALARIIANWQPAFYLDILHQYTFETTIRLCHGLFPLFIYFLIKKEKISTK